MVMSNFNIELKCPVCSGAVPIEIVCKVGTSDFKLEPATPNAVCGCCGVNINLSGGAYVDVKANVGKTLTEAGGVEFVEKLYLLLRSRTDKSYPEIVKAMKDRVSPVGGSWAMSLKELREFIDTGGESFAFPKLFNSLFEFTCSYLYSETMDVKTKYYYYSYFG